MTRKVSARRYLAVWLPLLASERVKRTRAAPPDAPFALTAKVKSAMRLVALDARASAMGLEAGLTLADARARVPELVAIDHDPGADLGLLEWLADACERYTPSVAIDGADTIVLDVTGCAPAGGKAGSHPKNQSSQKNAALLGVWGEPTGETGEKVHPKHPKDQACRDAGRFGPLGENLVAAAPQGAIADDLVARMAKLGLTARIGSGPTPDMALALARYGGEHVAALPVAALRADGETLTALRRAGLKTVGDLAARPRAPLAARFGKPLVDRLDRLVLGVDVRITPRREPPPVHAEQRFAEPVARDDDVLATLDALMREVSVQLEQRGEGGRRFEAALYRSDGHVARLRVETATPTRDPDMLGRLLRERIATLADPLDPGFGYDLISFAVPLCEPLGVDQLRLEGGAVAAAEIASLIDRLATRMGRGRVLKMQPVDTHIPEQAVLELPVAEARAIGWRTPEPGEPPARPIHLFDPPQPIEVMAQVPDGPPKRFKWRRAFHDVSRAEGPERIAAEWWTRNDNAGLTRDYYRVEDARGRRFWVFRHGLYDEKANPAWYLHGLFA